MPNVGDSVQVNISGGNKGLKLGSSNASIGIGSGASMSVPGKIIQDLGNEWLIELSMSIGGKNQIRVPKGNIS